jgi:hypothetical protein
MVAWRESSDEWRFERLRVLVERVREAIRPVRPRRHDAQPEQKRRDAAKRR